MFEFKFLRSLLTKNARLQSYFPKTALWQSKNLFGGTTTNISVNSKKIDTQVDSGSIHWKKAVKLKFEAEVKEEEPNRGTHLELDSILRPGEGGRDEIECGICDKIFERRRELNAHKRLEHFPSWEGGTKEFCFVPYFVEPKRFSLLRGTLSKSHPECSLCRKWVNGRVKEKAGRYLEGLRLMLKEKGENEANKEKVPTPSKRTKNRGRRMKPSKHRSCHLCSKVLSNRKGLERHMLIHTGEKPFPCDICGKPFRRKDNCVRHKKTAHLFKKPRKARRRKHNLFCQELDSK